MNATKKDGISQSIEPYLFFGGRCEEALEFYKSELDAQVGAVMRFRDNPEPPPPGVVPPGFEDKIMHCVFRIRGTAIMASDGCGEEPGFKGFSLTLSVPSEKEAARVFGLLSNGGQVQMPLKKTFWSPCFGMVTDRFGVSWMVMVPGEEA
ncbi:MAG: VOC family protein [Alphaproteobacteria bacterium]|nr:VOC family protein [Alphaproteobacteria bacterium]